MELNQKRNTLLDFASYQFEAASGKVGGPLEQFAGVVGLLPGLFAFASGHLLDALRNKPNPLELPEIGSNNQSATPPLNRTVLKATHRVSGNVKRSLLPQEKKVITVSNASLNQENLQELLNEVGSNNLQLRMAIKAMYTILEAKRSTLSTKEEFNCEGITCRIGVNPEKHQVIRLAQNEMPDFATPLPVEPQNSQTQMKPTVIGKGSYKTHELRLKKIGEKIIPIAFTKITAANLVQNPEIYKGLVLQQELKHPNIAKISLYFKNQDLCVECAYFNRGSLEKFIARFPHECKIHQVGLVKAILAPLAFLAKYSIHHRDVKRANYLVRYNGTSYELQLSDFDLAIDENSEYQLYMQDRDKQNKQDSDRQNSEDFFEDDYYTNAKGVFAGAANYISPEYATVFLKGPRSTDMELRTAATTKGDVWGAGISIYYLAFNQYPPFLKKIKTSFEQLSNIVCVTENTINELRSPDPYTSWPLSLIKQLLQPNPQKRISAEEALITMGCEKEQ